MAKEKPALPISKKWLVDGFCWFTQRMIAKQFNAFGVQKELLDTASLHPYTPIIVYANHPSWWDPITAMLIRKAYFPDRVFYAPIDAIALEKYRIMSKLGFYGLQLETTAGAAEFLATTKRILETKNSSIWITPEGRFTDARDHSQSFMPGLAHLAAKLPGVAFVPMALETTFWNESRPQLFARLGAATINNSSRVSETSRSKSDWNELLTAELRKTQNELKDAVLSRDSSRFEYIVASQPNRLGWYDYFRSWSAWAKGQPFDPRHSTG